MSSQRHHSPPQKGSAAILAHQLRAGHVYRREDITRLSSAVDRDLGKLVAAGQLNNLDELAEDRDDVLGRARALWPARVSPKLLQAVELYGNAATRKHIKAWMDDPS